MLRQVQVLLERAAGDAEGAADLLRRDAPRDLVVSGLERGHEGGRLLRGKGREEEGRAERLSRGSVREGALRQEPPPGEEGRELAEVRRIVHEEGHAGLAPLPSDRRDDV